uniref:hypothetical protein n=1 Tax=Akkermansia muciniphila TaxID=239935 RepID=UPI003FD6CCA5
PSPSGETARIRNLTSSGQAHGKVPVAIFPVAANGRYPSPSAFSNKTRRYLLLGEKACFVINMTSFPFPETIDLFNSDGDQTTDIRHSHLITRQLLQRTELL